MKTKDLVKLFQKNGWQLLRYGANHDVYVKEKEIEAVPRHTETTENLAKAIIKRRGLK